MLASHSKLRCRSSSSSSRLAEIHLPLLQQCKARSLSQLRPSTRVFAASEPPQQPEQRPDVRQLQQSAEAAGTAAASGAQPAAVPASKQLVAANAAGQQLASSTEAVQQHSASHAMATSLYLALAGGLAAAGLLVATFAAPVAAGCLSLGSLPLQQAAALVGCCGAALLRAASLAAFIAVSTGLGDNACMPTAPQPDWVAVCWTAVNMRSQLPWVVTVARYRTCCALQCRNEVPPQPPQQCQRHAY
jgi:hypothetical protein